MHQKIKGALFLYGAILPKQVKEILLDLGAEVDKLRADIEELKKGK